MTIQRAGPAPMPFEPDHPVTGMELGLTGPGKTELPHFTIKTEAATAGHGRRGRPAPTTIGNIEVDSHYVTAGIHDMTPAPGGGPRKLLVTDEIADVAKQGEQEHSDDIWWGHQLVAGEAARAVNKLAGEPAGEAANAQELHSSLRQALHDEISPKLRITADASDPAKNGSVTGPWYEALAKLQDSSLGRDTAKWHTMSSRSATVKERTDHHITDAYLMVAVRSGEIGSHPAEARMRAAFDALPDRT
jgi:hypothetical protein